MDIKGEPTMKYEYKVVRSYTDGTTSKSKDLVAAFNDGYEFVRASEVVKNSKDYGDYIEYILQKEIPDTSASEIIYKQPEATWRGLYRGMHSCSLCGCTIEDGTIPKNFCPGCGAKMTNA